MNYKIFAGYIFAKINLSRKNGEITLSSTDVRLAPVLKTLFINVSYHLLVASLARLVTSIGCDTLMKIVLLTGASLPIIMFQLRAFNFANMSFKAIHKKVIV